MRIDKYLTDVMRQLGFDKDKDLAEWLGVSPAAVSQYRAGTRSMDNEKCVKVALELRIDPMKVIMATDLDKADRTGHKSIWEVFMARAAMTAGAVLMASGVNLFLTPGPANAASMRVADPAIAVSIDYAKLWFRSRKT
jgi:uncharacterized protein YaiE (UPF0345 family)